MRRTPALWASALFLITLYSLFTPLDRRTWRLCTEGVQTEARIVEKWQPLDMRRRNEYWVSYVFSAKDAEKRSGGGVGRVSRSIYDRVIYPGGFREGSRYFTADGRPTRHSMFMPGSPGRNPKNEISIIYARSDRFINETTATHHATLLFIATHLLLISACLIVILKTIVTKVKSKGSFYTNGV